MDFFNGFEEIHLLRSMGVMDWRNMDSARRKPKASFATVTRLLWSEYPMRHLSRKRANVWQTLFKWWFKSGNKIDSIYFTYWIYNKKQCNLYRITQVLSNQCLTLKNTPLCRKKANKKENRIIRPYYPTLMTFY